jgi:hypothetical protein
VPKHFDKSNAKNLAVIQTKCSYTEIFIDQSTFHAYPEGMDSHKRKR